MGTKNILTFLVLGSALLKIVITIDPQMKLDADRDFKDIVLSRGYAYQDYKMVTDDGYILSLHRIPSKL